MSNAVWFIVSVVVIILVIVVVLYYYNSSNSNSGSNNNNASRPIDDYIDNEIDNFNHEVNLYTFEDFYRSTLWKTKDLRTDYNETDILFEFVEDDYDIDIFKSLKPFENAKDFAQLLRSLNAHAIYMNAAAATVNFDETNNVVATRLARALKIIANKLPTPTPYKHLPWNFDEMYWNLFSISLTECAMLLSITLRPYVDVSKVAVKIIDNYITEPNMSLGWRRNIGFSTRMCLPYIYAQLCKGVELSEIKSQPLVMNVLEDVQNYVHNEGSGIRFDFINYVDANVRNYSFLIENYYTFQYYNFLFGPNFVVMQNVDHSLHMVGSNSGRIHPALLYKNGVHVMPVISKIMYYKPGVYAADFSKVVTVRNEYYFSSLVAPVNNVAYYQANYDFRTHALLWSMTKRIWNDNEKDDEMPTYIDAGVILLENDVVKLPENDVLISPNTTMSFLPNPGFTAIVNLDDCAAVMSFSKFDALNLEFYSYTLFYKTGMLQLYDQIKAVNSTNRDARCVVLKLNHNQKNKFAIIEKNNVYKNSQLYTVQHHNIENYKQLPPFEPGSINNNNNNYDDDDDNDNDIVFLYQRVPVKDVNEGEGTVCYSMTSTSPDDITSSLKISKENKLKRNFKVVTNDNEIECIFEFPYVLIKNNKTRQVSINNAYQTTKHTHIMYFDEIEHILGQVGMRIVDLKSDLITRTSLAFTFENTLGNQFKFHFV
uniref:Odv-e66b n=1 Tax=Spodoptera frugiperda nuclear polyhedrosis virus TaxID=10455 RepID=E9L6B0_NPVSF|nr:odv-e66b [Spodoptera frugiperda multiple nucleopolyhedrovirus]QED40315.1 ODV-E66B [Spodoptera frugiperda multiple nucleopolyhedrovirus]QRN46228.1 ODV-E66b [Spodoptera frugiperda multiple nucleopolyhedrovirus]